MVERGGMLAQREIDVVRKVTATVFVTQREESIVRWHWERLEQPGVGGGEDGDVGAETPSDRVSTTMAAKPG